MHCISKIKGNHRITVENTRRFAGRFPCVFSDLVKPRLSSQTYFWFFKDYVYAISKAAEDLKIPFLIRRVISLWEMLHGVNICSL